MPEHIACLVDEVTVGRCTIVEIDRREIGIFRVADGFVAFLNVCPHQGAPVCRGTVESTVQATLPGEYDWKTDVRVLRCPWHGWEFQLKSGEALFDANVRLKKLPIRQVDDKLVVSL